ncbi:MAG: Gfo/Idh/MocA family protein, partial [Chloroflexota bacterium]
SRDLDRAEEFARRYDIERALADYDALLGDAQIDAVYIPLPNSMHPEWTIAALRAGKTVLCEKPLGTTSKDTREVIEAARENGQFLWEAFVYPFHHQTRRLMELIGQGAIGEVREIQTSWHFPVKSRANIRLSRELEGGALNDIGCYGISLSRLVFATEPDAAVALAVMAPEGVDEEAQAVLGFSDDRRLLLSVGMRRGPYQNTTIFGTGGQIQLSNPFHPGPSDTLQLQRGKDTTIEHVGESEPSFTAAIRHIHAVLHGEEAPRHLAVDEAMGNARALEAVHRVMKAPPT